MPGTSQSVSSSQSSYFELPQLLEPSLVHFTKSSLLLEMLTLLTLWVVPKLSYHLSVVIYEAKLDVRTVSMHNSLTLWYYYFFINATLLDCTINISLLYILFSASRGAMILSIGSRSLSYCSANASFLLFVSFFDL